MIISYYPFLLLLAWTGVSADCPCENNGTCVENITACLCPPEFIGQTCNYPAILLTPKPQNLSISENYSYVYLLPEDLSFYSVELKFCLEKSVPNYFNEFYLTLEGLENEFTPGKIEDKKMYPLIFGEDSCIS